nr:MAG TPA: hypothetical protein [Caudoviricetes sp.]
MFSISATSFLDFQRFLFPSTFVIILYHIPRDMSTLFNVFSKKIFIFFEKKRLPLVEGVLSLYRDF